MNIDLSGNIMQTIGSSLDSVSHRLLKEWLADILFFLEKNVERRGYLAIARAYSGSKTFQNYAIHAIFDFLFETRIISFDKNHWTNIWLKSLNMLQS